MTESYYKLETESYTFYLTITKGQGTDTVSIRGRKGGCINISINKPDSLAVQRGYHQLDVASIPILAWNAKCAVDKDLVRGSGTVAMINTILSEVIKRYPYIKLLKFTDNSNITCDNGRAISLLFLSLVEHSKTWYERHYGAFLYEPSLNRKYKEGIQHLSDADVKLSFHDFQAIIKHSTDKSTLDKLKPYYESSPTYLAFFKSILEKEGKSALCNIIVDWINVFITHIFEFDPLSATWAIPSSAIQPIYLRKETTLNRKPNNNQSGGRRYTRTRRNNTTLAQSSHVSISDILEEDSKY